MGNVEGDHEAFDRWLAQIRSQYDLVDQQRHTFPIHHKDRDLLGHTYLDLYEFVPRGEQPAGLWSNRSGQESHGPGTAGEERLESLCRQRPTQSSERQLQ